MVVPVVLVLPLFKHLGAFSGVGVGDIVGPFAQGALDEVLGLAIGLWAVGAGELVLDPQPSAGESELSGAERGAVICQQTLNAQPQGWRDRPSRPAGRPRRCCIARRGTFW